MNGCTVCAVQCPSILQKKAQFLLTVFSELALKTCYLACVCVCLIHVGIDLPLKRQLMYIMKWVNYTGDV